MIVGCCTPSRGLVHSRTEEAIEAARIEAETLGLTFRRFYTHDRPIPDCFNEVVGQAYDSGAALIWIVEEDVAPPPETFTKSFLALRDGADIAVADYPMRRKPTPDGHTYPGVVRDGAGRVTWCRTGCIMLERYVFNAMPRPWFSLHGRLVRPGVVVWQSPQASLYGADADFTECCFELGFKFAVIEPDAQHLEVIEMGNCAANDGTHVIRAIPGPAAPHVELNRRQ